MKKNIAIVLLGSLALSMMTGCSSTKVTGTMSAFGIQAEEETKEAGEKASEEETVDWEITTVEETEQEGEPETVSKEEEVEEKVMSNDLFDFTFSINGDTIAVPCWFEDMENMGWEYAGDDSKMIASEGNGFSYFVKDHVILETQLYNPSINATQAKNCEITKLTFYPEYASENDQASAKVTLPGGIKVFESDRDEILKAYGEPQSHETYSDDDWMTYSKEDCISEVNLWLDKETGILNTVEIENEIPFKLDDEKVSTEKPASIDEYQTPKKVSQDPFDYTCEFDGDLYSFPCPVTAFLDNGWEVSDDHIGDTVGGGSVNAVMLNRNDKEIFVYLRNYEDVALPVEYGFAQCIDANDLKTSVPMTISGNLTIGSKESDITKVFDQYDCTIDTTKYELGTCYHIQDAEYNGYYIYVNDGTVDGIELQNYVQYE